MRFQKYTKPATANHEAIGFHNMYYRSSLYHVLNKEDNVKQGKNVPLCRIYACIHG